MIKRLKNLGIKELKNSRYLKLDSRQKAKADVNACFFLCISALLHFSGFGFSRRPGYSSCTCFIRSGSSLDLYNVFASRSCSMVKPVHPSDQHHSGLAPFRLASLRSAPLSQALVRSALFISAPLRLAPFCFTPLRLASLSLAPVRLELNRLALARSASLRSASLRSAPFHR